MLDHSEGRSRWLLTGGAGYIGSHVAHALMDRGIDVVVVDDLSTGERRRVPSAVNFFEAGVASQRFREIIRETEPSGVIHLAAKKSVPDGQADPAKYYRENLSSTLKMMESLENSNVCSLLYSSTAAVYGEVDSSPVSESTRPSPTSVYGQTKLAAEWATRSICRQKRLSWAALRYFNVVGARSAALSDTGKSNLVPAIFEAVRSGEPLQVFGADWETYDGTCVRDYIHVADIAEAHAFVVESIDRREKAVDLGSFNVGRNVGVSVLEMIAAVERVTGLKVPYELVDRRDGDIASVVADAGAISSALGWVATHGVEEMLLNAEP